MSHFTKCNNFCDIFGSCDILSRNCFGLCYHKILVPIGKLLINVFFIAEQVGELTHSKCSYLENLKIPWTLSFPSMTRAIVN